MQVVDLEEDVFQQKRASLTTAVWGTRAGIVGFFLLGTCVLSLLMYFLLVNSCDNSTLDLSAKVASSSLNTTKYFLEEKLNSYEKAMRMNMNCIKARDMQVFELGGFYNFSVEYLGHQVALSLATVPDIITYQTKHPSTLMVEVQVDSDPPLAIFTTPARVPIHHSHVINTTSFEISTKNDVTAGPINPESLKTYDLAKDLDSGQMAWSSHLAFHRNVTEIMCSLSSPIFDPHFSGVVTKVVGMLWLEQHLLDICSHCEIEAFVLREDGKLMVASNPDTNRDYIGLNHMTEEFELVEWYSVTDSRINNSLINAASKLLLEQFGTFSQLPDYAALVEIEGRKFHLGTVSTRNFWKGANHFIDSQWHLVMLIDHEHTIADLLAENRRTSFLTWSLTAILGFLWVLLSVFLTMPMKKKISLEIKINEEEKRRHKFRTDFIGNMSHELRQPLTGVLGTVDLLLDSSLDTQQQSLTKDIESSALMLLHLVNDVLDLSKIEAGKLRLEAIPSDVEKLVLDTIRLVTESAWKKGVSIALRIDSSVPPLLMVDPLRLGQIIINFLTNAIKFSPQNSEIMVQINSKGNGLWKIVVIDEGIGVSPENFDQLFESFDQGNSEVSREHGGTGLGLSIVKKISGLMQGDAGVESDGPGKGSTFWATFFSESSDQAEYPSHISLPELPDSTKVRLPFSPLVTRTLTTGLPSDKQSDNSTDSETDTGEVSPDPDPGAPKQLLPTPESQNRPHILVVEDNIINQRILKRMIANFGGEVTITKDGVEGLEFFTEHFQEIDIVFMDIQMPKMDGMECTRRIREFEEKNGLGEIPIIAITANVLSSEKETILHCGMSDFLGKPFRMNGLEEITKRWLPHSKLAIIGRRVEKSVDK